MQTSRKLRNSDRNPEIVEESLGEEDLRPLSHLSRLLKTNVLKQMFSTTYSKSKAETTYFYWIPLAINPKGRRKNLNWIR